MKRALINHPITRSFWGDGAHKWAYSPLDVLSGGLLLIWNADRVKVHDVVKGSFSISVLYNMAGSDDYWVCCMAYGPCGPNGKAAFWREIRDVQAVWSSPIVIFGDFNAVCAPGIKMVVRYAKERFVILML